jgi:hypothetical protein
MDKESLKLIIDAINSLGANSKDVFIWWLIVQYGATYIFGTVWSLICIYVIRSGYALLHNHSISEKLRSAAGVTYSWNSSEVDAACDTLRKHYKKG